MKKYNKLQKLAFIALAMLMAPTVNANFPDVSSTHQNFDAINYVQEQKIVNGYSNGNYQPNKKINRAEFTKIIINATKDDIKGSNCFPDVKDEWFAKYICTAKENGIINGYPNGTFKPANKINFAEASKIIINAFSYKINDENNENWYHPFVQILGDKKSIPTTITNIDKEITRGEMAEIIYRLNNKITTSSSLTYNDFSKNNIQSTKSPTISSCQIFPPDNPWNTDISNFPIHPNSDAYINSMGKNGRLHPDFGSNTEYGIPFITVNESQPKININFTDYGDESDAGPYPIPLNAPIEGGNQSDGDRHVIAIDTNTCTLYELYNAFPQNSSWNASCGAKYDLNSNNLRPDYWTSTDAAGLPVLAGLVRYDEVKNGEIKHALRFTVESSQRAFIHPATHYASSSTNTNLPPMGLRIRLKKDYDTSGYTGQSRIILEGLKKYGMIVADNGSDWFITGESNSNWNDDDLQQLKTIPGNAFEAVYTGDIIQ